MRVVVLACLTAVTACKKDPPPDPDNTGEPAPTAPAAEPSAAPDAAPTTGATDEKTVMARIEKHWTGTLGKSCGPMSVVHAQEDVGVAGADVWAAVPSCTDRGGYRCVVTASDVYCEDESGKELERAVRAFGLHAEPKKLGDDQWVALVSSTLGVAVVRSPADLAKHKRKVPKAAQDKIAAPAVKRSAAGGATVELVDLQLDLHTGQIGLARVRVKVAADGAVSVARDAIGTF